MDNNRRGMGDNSDHVGVVGVEEDRSIVDLAGWADVPRVPEES